jgi:acyl-coenzyme A synthetase/AMP-(fatty) acid ligase
MAPRSARPESRTTSLVPDDDTPPPAPRSEDDLYAVLFTSGSTGRPRIDAALIARYVEQLRKHERL